MKLRKPSYYDRFHCIGSACSDTCCANWEIEVDEESAGRYAALTGVIGERMKHNLVIEENEAYFAMNETRRCPFLNRENLCDLILECGEEILCDICREHPRHYEWFGDYTEVGLGLCCEEAERLLLTQEEPLTFQVEESEGETEAEIEDQTEDQSSYINLFLKARETAYSIVQNREMKVEDRLILLLQYGEELQESLDLDELDAMEQSAAIYQNQASALAAWKQMLRICGEPERSDAGMKAWQQIFEIYSGLEALNPDWKSQMVQIAEQLPAMMERRESWKNSYGQAERDYENLTVYFLYRYFMEALFDGDILGKIKFAVISILVIYGMDLMAYEQKRDVPGENSGKPEPEFELTEQLAVIRRYSKEVEYCTENMELLLKACWEEECMSTEQLTEVLKLLM